MPRLLLPLMVLLATLITGCSKKPTLHVYNWADYVKPELIQRFEQENNCKVVVDNYESNETLLARLQGGATGYDLIFPSSYMVKIMRDQGMIEPLKLDQIPNAKLVDSVWLQPTSDPKMVHSVPYMVSFTVLAYRDDKVSGAEASWALLEREDLKGKITLLDDMRETIGAALKALGYSANTLKDGELAAARDLVIKWKKNIAKFESEQYKTGLASGEFALVHGYNGDLLQVASETPGITIALPKEGFLVNVDHMVIPKGAKQVALAHKFINFMHDPAVAAENTEAVQFLCPNTGSYPLLSEETSSNPAIMPSPSLAMKGEAIEDLGENLAKYSKIWDEIQAAD